MSLDSIIRELSRRIRRHPRTLLGWFDDAGAIEFGGRYVLVKVDGFAASRALYPWCSYRDLGFRAVTGAVSDVYAKGCRPYIYAVSLGVTPGKIGVVEELTSGIEEAVEIYGGYIENVDTNIGADFWVDVFVLAECATRPLKRAAIPTDTVVLTRRVGLSSIAYLEYSAGRVPSFDEVREFSCRPRAEAAVVRALEVIRSCVSGSIDISDTLLESLQQLVEPPGLGLYLDLNPSNALHPLATSYAYEMSIPKHVLLFSSNEEYVPVLACRTSCVEAVVDILKSLGLEPVPLGTVIDTPGIHLLGRRIEGISWDYTSGKIKLET